MIYCVLCYYYYRIKRDLVNNTKLAEYMKTKKQMYFNAVFYIKMIAKSNLSTSEHELLFS